MPRTKLAKFAVVVLLAAVLSTTGWAQKGAEHWVSAWSTAVQLPLQFPGAPALPSFENKTIRMIVRPTIGGEQVRVRFSNAFGTSALTIASAHIALVTEGAKIVPESDRVYEADGKTFRNLWRIDHHDPFFKALAQQPSHLHRGGFDGVAARRCVGEEELQRDTLAEVMRQALLEALVGGLVINAAGEIVGEAGHVRDLVVEIVRRHTPNLGEGSVSARPSKGGNYTAITVVIEAHSRQQLDAIYLDLNRSPHILMTL